MTYMNVEPILEAVDYTVVLGFPKSFRDAEGDVPCWVGFASGTSALEAAGRVQEAAAQAYPEVRGPNSFPVMLVFKGRHYDQLPCNPVAHSEGPSGDAFTSC
ncbi:hypothetical protein [Thioalkalivibrio sp. ALE16]|uniref:hypothetical protein n=1 Tax=Thioalkalivibrio sp. ALE16 TaxID=1158172 RepID=UPI0003697214|nr:hypothetical protein [Thioalkalivibrio sp. ALE16]